jgi:hypothetical protein
MVMSTSSRKRGTIKILTLFCLHTVRRVNDVWPMGVPCPHCGTREVVLRVKDTGRLARSRRGLR